MRKDSTLLIAGLYEGHQIVLTLTNLPEVQRSGHLAGQVLTVLDGHGILDADVCEVYGSRPAADEEEWQGRRLFVTTKNDHRVYILYMPSDQLEVKCV